MVAELFDVEFIGCVYETHIGVNGLHFLAGDFATVKKFTITDENMTLEEFSSILRNSNWGYELKLTNLQWKADSTFILTYKTSRQNTQGMEQYHGKVVNDTAKLFFNESDRKSPFSIKK